MPSGATCTQDADAHDGWVRATPLPPQPREIAVIMIKACIMLVTASTAGANLWAGQVPSSNAAFVGAPVGRSAPWGLGSRWLSSQPATARVGAVSRNAVERLNALSMKLGEDEKVCV